ncbi:MAG: SPASM domain-containing protein [Clostridiales bacterium]|nr:SPASM domain-containing protein [Clostridiales bacterium]
MKYNASIYNIVIKESGDSVYLYNSYSGAFAKLEKRVYDTITTQTIFDEQPCEYFEQLLAEGFIKPLELNEYNRIITQERVAVYERSDDSLSFVIAPTLVCNLNCSYCFESSSRCNKSLSEQSVNDIVAFISKRLRMQTRKLHITWFGGEPLMAYQTILDFNKKLKDEISSREIAYSASMITNGTLLDEYKTRTLAEHCALSNVQITIDGTQEIYCKQKGATPKQFEQVINNIVSALNYLKVSIRLNCAKDNFDDLKQVVATLVSRCGAHKNLHFYLAKLVDYSCSCSANFCSQVEFDRKNIEFEKYICKLMSMEYKLKLPKYRKSFCGLYKLKNYVIGPDGELYKCEHHVGREEQVIGNVRQGLYYSDAMLDFINLSFLEKCKTCKLFPLCLGGCPSQRQDIKNREACNISMVYIKDLLLDYIDANEEL